jgi:hypothetical protein
VLPLGWVEVSTKVGTGYGRNMDGKILHICTKCSAGLRVSILHPTGVETPVLCGIADVAPDFGKMYEGTPL